MAELNDRLKKSAEDFSLIPSSVIWKNIERDIRRRIFIRRLLISSILIVCIITGGILLIKYYFNDQIAQFPSQKNNSALLLQSLNNKETTGKTNNPAEQLSQTRKASEYYYKDKQPRNQFIISVPDSESNSLNFDSIRSGTYENYPASENQTQPDVTTSITQDNMATPDDSTISKTVLNKEVNDSLFSAISGVPETVRNTAIMDTVNPFHNKRKWSISLEISPAKNLTKIQEEGDYQFIAKYRNSTDKNLLSWNFRLNFSYEIYPELEIYSGIGIVNFEEQILKKQIVYHYDSLLTYPPYIVNISSTYFHINGDSTGSIKNKITYLEIPAGIHYYIFHGKKFSISLQPEISFNRIIRSEIYTVDSIKREYSKNNAFLRSWTVSYGAGLGFHYSIRDNMSIGLTPFFRNFQKSIFLPSCPVSQKVQQVELRISVKYFL